MANYSGQISLNDPNFTYMARSYRIHASRTTDVTPATLAGLVVRGYRTRFALQSPLTPAVMAGLVVRGYRTRYTKSVQRLGSAVAVNRVFDSVAGRTVFWETSAPDPSGIYYPGPGTFGVSTSGYTIVGSR